MKGESMRKIIWFNLVSLDGFFEGPAQDISWHNVDEEFNEFAIEQTDAIQTLLFGRVTYEMMAGYWPTQQALADDPVVAKQMNSREKIVFSKTLKAAAWNNTKLVRGDAVEEVAHLKQQEGGDMAVFGSGKLGNKLLEAGLIDEIRLLVNPLLLHKGRPMFEDGGKPIKLILIGTRAFANGNVLLNYRPDTKGNHS
jgi:dihydrofolate reductase